MNAKMATRHQAVQCRCILYNSKSKERVDQRCPRMTTSAAQLCRQCLTHRLEDSFNKRGTYQGRWGLARRKS